MRQDFNCLAKLQIILATEVFGVLCPLFAIDISGGTSRALDHAGRNAVIVDGLAVSSVIFRHGEQQR